MLNLLSEIEWNIIFKYIWKIIQTETLRNFWILMLLMTYCYPIGELPIGFFLYVKIQVEAIEAKEIFL